ncbi:MAG: Fe(3+) ABC transporter substrate-binding protein [Bacteroidota bacterium]
MKKIYLLILMGTLLVSCKNDQTKTEEQEPVNEPQEVTIYTHRHYPADQELFAEFEKESGITVNVVNASADELVQKMKQEGSNSPADVLITVDAGRLVRAQQQGLLQGVSSELLSQNIPAHLRDEQGHWFALTKRARVIAYAKGRVDPKELSTYENLAADAWKTKILLRSSSNIYNQSLMASIIANDGAELARGWAEKIVNNMARSPQGNDRDQVKAVVAGDGDLAIVNTYYIGKLLNSEDPVEVEAGEGVGIFFPNQDGRGTHINISGAGVAKHAPNMENAIKFIEFLSGEKAQSVFAQANYEYPVNPKVSPSALLQSWGTFKEDTLALSKLGENNKRAVMILDQVGWK